MPDFNRILSEMDARAAVPAAAFRAVRSSGPEPFSRQLDARGLRDVTHRCRVGTGMIRSRLSAPTAGRPPPGIPHPSRRERRMTAARPTRSRYRPDEIQDLLGSMTDRSDLERLFGRSVGFDSLVRLMGRHVSREEVHALLKSSRLEDDLRELLK